MFLLVKWIISMIAGLIAYIYMQNPKLDGYVHEDLGLEIDQLVNKYHYPLEKHQIVTQDDYILELHRIPNNGNTYANAKYKRPAVLLMHGLLESSISFVLGGPGHSLPYYLAENGYDVWLGNTRGNEYSRKHRFIDPDENPGQFFNFSWHEIGAYDLPASIDYILDTTGNRQISYIGHSQGCTIFFVMLSERPEYNEKVKIMVSFAPVVYTKKIKSLAFNVPAIFQELLEWGHEALGFHELLPTSYTWVKVVNTFCHERSYIQLLCTIHVGLTAGFNYPQMNLTHLPVVLSHIPAGSSTKQLLHFTQILNSDIFRKYDFGEKGNFVKYGQMTPPLYNLENVNVPVAIFYGNNDWLTSERDIRQLESQLPRVVMKHKIIDENFSHFDFITCIDVIHLLYKHVIKIL